MTHTQASYRHPLGNGLYLEAFAIDPSLNQDDLEQFLASKEGTAQPNSDAAKDVSYVGSVNDFDGLEVRIDLEKRYQVPAQLQAYREAVGRVSGARGWYDGPVAVVDGPLGIPLHLFQGGYYDYVATKLSAVPSDLVPEYPCGKTIAQLFEEWNIASDRRARSFGFAHLLMADEGKEICLVQRAKGMAIAPDCISFPGSTPNPRFEPHFDFPQYCRHHIEEEMNEEFKLEDSEFRTGRLHLFEDRREVPFAALEIHTPLPLRDIAARIYGDQQAIKEHPVIYAVPREGILAMLEKLPLFPSGIQMFRTLYDTYNHH